MRWIVLALQAVPGRELTLRYDPARRLFVARLELNDLNEFAQETDSTAEAALAELDRLLSVSRDDEILPHAL